MGEWGAGRERYTKLDDVGAEVVESAFAEEEAAPEAGLSLLGVRVEEPDGAVGGLLALVRLGVECFLLELGLLADFVAQLVEEVGGGVFPLRRLCRLRPGRPVPASPVGGSTRGRWWCRGRRGSRRSRRPCCWRGENAQSGTGSRRPGRPGEKCAGRRQSARGQSVWAPDKNAREDANTSSGMCLHLGRLTLRKVFGRRKGERKAAPIRVQECGGAFDVTLRKGAPERGGRPSGGLV